MFQSKFEFSGSASKAPVVPVTSMGRVTRKDGRKLKDWVYIVYCSFCRKGFLQKSAIVG